MKLSRRKILAWVFRKEPADWLVVLRVGLGLQIVAYTWSLRRDWNYLFSASESEWISRRVGEAVISTQSSLIPKLGWLVGAGNIFGVSEQLMLSVIWATLLLSGCFLIIGFCSRAAAAVAWFLQLASVKSGGMFAYGADAFTTIGLLYLMLAPAGTWSLDHWLGRKTAVDLRLSGLVRRLLQLHLCIIYFFGGLTKCLGRDWWNGSNLWRSLVRPPFNILDPGLVAHCQWILPIAGIGICLLELSYPFFIWGRQTRGLWLLCICAMHLGIGLVMGMRLFAAVMIVLNVAAFGPAAPRLLPRKPGPAKSGGGGAVKFAEALLSTTPTENKTILIRATDPTTSHVRSGRNES